MQACRITLCHRKKGATGHAASVRNDSNLQFEIILKQRVSVHGYVTKPPAQAKRSGIIEAFVAPVEFRTAGIGFAGRLRFPSW
jgi:hypothetical protein